MRFLKSGQEEKPMEATGPSISPVSNLTPFRMNCLTPQGMRSREHSNIVRPRQVGTGAPHHDRT